MKNRTDQDLLAERRSNCIELMRERDRTARAMLMAHIATIDAEMARRHPRLVCSPPVDDCPCCGGHGHAEAHRRCVCVAPEVAS